MAGLRTDASPDPAEHPDRRRAKSESTHVKLQASFGPSSAKRTLVKWARWNPRWIDHAPESEADTIAEEVTIRSDRRSGRIRELLHKRHALLSWLQPIDIDGMPRYMRPTAYLAVALLLPAMAVLIRHPSWGGYGPTISWGEAEVPLILAVSIPLLLGFASIPVTVGALCHRTWWSFPVVLFTGLASIATARRTATAVWEANTTTSAGGLTGALFLLVVSVLGFAAAVGALLALLRGVRFRLTSPDSQSPLVPALMIAAGLAIPGLAILVAAIIDVTSSVDALSLPDGIAGHVFGWYLVMFRILTVSISLIALVEAYAVSRELANASQDSHRMSYFYRSLLPPLGLFAILGLVWLFGATSPLVTLSEMDATNMIPGGGLASWVWLAAASLGCILLSLGVGPQFESASKGLLIGVLIVNSQGALEVLSRLLEMALGRVTFRPLLLNPTGVGQLSMVLLVVIAAVVFQKNRAMALGMGMACAMRAPFVYRSSANIDLDLWSLPQALISLVVVIVMVLVVQAVGGKAQRIDWRGAGIVLWACFAVMLLVLLPIEVQPRLAFIGLTTVLIGKWLLRGGSSRAHHAEGVTMSLGAAAAMLVVVGAMGLYDYLDAMHPDDLHESLTLWRMGLDAAYRVLVVPMLVLLGRNVWRGLLPEGRSAQ